MIRREDEHPEGLDALIVEYMDRLIAGERLDREAILTKHPDSAQAILKQLEVFVDIDPAVPPNGPGAGESLGTLGDYVLRRQIGRGGMGVVYEAWQHSLDRRVALKVLPVGVAADNRAFLRFMREAKTAGQLNHANIVQVHGMGVEEQTPYYAMEYVEGETLASVLRRIKDAPPDTKTPFGPKDEVDYFARLSRAFSEVADGLYHAHAKGVIHRDIKPSNLILDREGRLRILDFGLAQLEGQESLTLSGDIVGTPSYMSPEQARAKKEPIDHRTDIYSLGATLYEALTLKPPFKGKDYLDTMSQIVSSDPVSPQRLNPRIPNDLETLVLKCLRKDPGDRYRTAEALAQDLRRFARGDAIEARPESTYEKLGRSFARHRPFFLGLLILMLAGLLALAAHDAVVVKARDEAQEARDEARYELYVAEMRLAMDAWRVGNLRRLEEVLERHVPTDDDAFDSRGWEWHYLEGLTRELDHNVLEGSPGASADAPRRWIRAVSWSPDGRWLSAVSDGGDLILWSGDSGERLGNYPLGGRSRSVAWRPDGELLAAGGGSVVKLFRVHTSPETVTLEEIEPFTEHKRKPTALAFSPDGRFLASAELNGEPVLRIWDPETRVSSEKLPLSGYASCYAWSPDGEWLAACAFRQGGGLKRSVSDLFLWDTATWSERRVDDAHSLYVGSIVWSPDGRQLVTGGRSQTPTFWDVETLQPERIETRHGRTLGSLVYSPDGAWFASSTSGHLEIAQAPSCREYLRLRGHRGTGVVSLAWSPDGTRLVSGGFDGTVRIWNAFEHQGSRELSGGSSAAWSSDGRWLASTVLSATDPGVERVAVIDAESEEIVVELGGAPAIFSLAFGPDSQLIALGAEKRLEVWDWQNARRILSRPLAAGGTSSIVFSEDGRFIATGGGAARIWNATTGEELHTLSGRVDALAFSPDSRKLAFGVARNSAPSPVVVVDTTTGEESHDLARVSGEVYDIEFSPSGETLATISDDGHLTIFEAGTGEVLHRVVGHTENGSSLTFSPDGRRLATGSGDGTVKIWDAETLKELITLRHVGKRAWVRSVGWHPDGKKLFSAGPGGLRIWDAGPGYEPEQP